MSGARLPSCGPSIDNFTVTFVPSAIPLSRIQAAPNRRKYACLSAPSMPRTAISLIVPETGYRGLAPQTSRGENGMATKVKLPSFCTVAANTISFGSLILILHSFSPMPAQCLPRGPPCRRLAGPAPPRSPRCQPRQRPTPAGSDALEVAVEHRAHARRHLRELGHEPAAQHLGLGLLGPRRARSPARCARHQRPGPWLSRTRAHAGHARADRC